MTARRLVVGHPLGRSGTVPGPSNAAPVGFVAVLVLVTTSGLIDPALLDGAPAMPSALFATVLGLSSAAGVLLLVTGRRHPLIALAGSTALFSAELAHWPVLGLFPWAGACYLVARHYAVRAIGPVAAAVIAASVLGGAAPELAAGQPLGTATAAGVDRSLRSGVVAAVPLLVGWTRAAAVRQRVRRTEELSRRRRAAALDQEKARIADELNQVVLTRLHRLLGPAEAVRVRVAQDTADATKIMEEVHLQAQQVLATMRRVLVMLRDGVRDGASDAHEVPTSRPARPPVPAPTRSGVVLALAAAALAVLLDAVSAPSGDPGLDGVLAHLAVPFDRPGALALITVQIGALAWWRSAPVAGFAAATLGTIASVLNGTPTLVAESSWYVLAVGVALARPPRRSALIVGTLMTGAKVLPALPIPVLGPLDPSLAGQTVSALAVAAVLWGIGVSLRVVERRRARAVLDRETTDSRVLIEMERHRVARELHDVVAHLVSAIAMQAAAARAVPRPGVVREAAGHIEECARRIRSAVPDLLRLSPRSEPVDLGPAGVEALIAPARTAGLPVTAVVSGTPGSGAGEADLFAMRVLMEALTNVLRHAGRSPTTVTVDHEPDSVRVRVSDSGLVGTPDLPAGAGLGLIGMQERVQLVGGSLVAGPDPDGGWTVQARLPRPAGPPAPQRQ